MPRRPIRFASFPSIMRHLRLWPQAAARPGPKPNCPARSPGSYTAGKARRSAYLGTVSIRRRSGRYRPMLEILALDKLCRRVYEWIVKNAPSFAIIDGRSILKSNEGVRHEAVETSGDRRDPGRHGDQSLRLRQTLRIRRRSCERFLMPDLIAFEIGFRFSSAAVQDDFAGAGGYGRMNLPCLIP
jgi:hypothetical protein